jgi:chemotaxis protein methyltransferase CheR
VGRPLRLWSAGCATGEEVATLLIMLDEARADLGSTVVGTDISEVALNRARTLSFPTEQVRRLQGGLPERYFLPDGVRSILVPELRERAIFQLHNLMEMPYPTASGGEGFDIIFCRNVLIYFTTEAFNRVVGLLAERLAPGGTLILSAAEPLLHAPPSLRIIRSEHAFFYVRTPDLLAAHPVRPPGMGGLPIDLTPSGLERRKDAGSFPPIMPPASAPPDWPKETGTPPGSVLTPEGKRDSGRFPAVGAEPRRDSGRYATVGAEPRRDSGRFPAVGSEPRRDSGRHATVGSEPRRDSGRFGAVPSLPVQGEPQDSGLHDRLEEHPLHVEADYLFALVLEGVGEGDSQPEDSLRRCLAMDPDLAAARYLLGMLLELRESFAEAATEYRRALHSLEAGHARSTPFFLNHFRLRVACQKAIERMEGGGRPR